MFIYLIQKVIAVSLVPRPSSHAVDPLPEKIKREDLGRPGKTYHATDVTGRKEVESCVGTDRTTPTEA